MMQTVFQTVITLSAIGSGLAVLLLLLKPVTKKAFSARWQYYVWLVVLLALTVPVTIKIPALVLNGTSTPLPVTEQTKTTDTPAQPAPTQETKMIENTPIEYRNIKLAQNVSIGVFDVLALVWLLGAVMFLSCAIVSYIAFKRKIKKYSVIIEKGSEFDHCRQKLKIRRNIQLRLADGITAPLLVGILRPAVLLPNMEVTSESLSFILLHELTHYKRKDLVYKWFALLVNAVHWFNPLVYLIIKNIHEDCEISCDMAVTKEMDEENKNRYMETILGLLSYSAAKKQTLTTAMCSDAKQIKRRFDMIKRSKKARKIVSVISVLTAVALTATVFAGSALAEAAKGGLEYRTQNEVYFISGVQLDMPVESNAPQWLKELAGKDNQVDVTFSNVETREMNGWVDNERILAITGINGKKTLKCDSNSYLYFPKDESIYINTPESQRQYITPAPLNKCNGVYVERGNEGVWAEIEFDYNRPHELTGISILFETSIPYSVNFQQSDINLFGNFAQDFENYVIHGHTNFFTSFEKNYKNRKVDGIDIKVINAGTAGIELLTNIARPDMKRINIDVFNESAARKTQLLMVRKDAPFDSSIILLPNKKAGIQKEATLNSGEEFWGGGLYPFTLDSGSTYRLDIAVNDKTGSIVYRQREYVTIP